MPPKSIMSKASGNYIAPEPVPTYKEWLQDIIDGFSEDQAKQFIAGTNADRLPSVGTMPNGRKVYKIKDKLYTSVTTGTTKILQPVVTVTKQVTEFELA